MELYIKNFFYFHIFSVFLVFKRDFIRRADFTRIQWRRSREGEGGDRPPPNENMPGR